MRFFLSALTLLLTGSLHAQPAFRPDYDQLKTYEGIYEYLDGATLQIAASPLENILYALIGDARYPLRPVRPDVFRNVANKEVIFRRGSAGTPAGYTVPDDAPDKLFRLLSTDVYFPQTMWYPRLPGERPNHMQPANRRDGLAVGTLEAAGLDGVRLQALLDSIAVGVHPDIHSVLIVRDGKLVFEEYFYEYGVDSLHQLRSATKSFVSALTGIALERGQLRNVDERVLPFFPEYTVQNPSAAKSAITIRHLLTNESALSCDIDDRRAAGNENDMGYSDDWAKYTLDLPMAGVPGDTGRYCSGNVIVLGRILEKVTGQPLPEFAKQTLFAPLGIERFRWHFRPDPSSAETFVQLYLRPRDMAKFGLLYLQNGVWNGRQLLSPQWVTQSMAKQSTIHGTDYGFLWWRPWLRVDGVRQDAVVARGNGGQRIYLRPDLNMVVVITAGSYNSQSHADALLARYILPAVR